MNRYDVFNRGQGFFIYLFHLTVFFVIREFMPPF